MVENNDFRVGLDVGSTTAKLAVIDRNDKIVYSEYKRHNAKIHETVYSILVNVKKELGNCKIGIIVTGSAGIGISEKFEIPFIQEVISSTEVIKKKYPEVKTLIDIGGEDSKMIFFSDNKPPDIRMNGSCAGGTGAFIDQMASLLNTSTVELNGLVKKHENIYSIASRCGVFAKTDVQNLISRKVPKKDIAASVFQAVAIQTMNTLARGHDIVSKVMYIGGPFTFLTELGKIFTKNLNLTNDDVIIPEKPELLPAYGAALNNDIKRHECQIEELLQKLAQTPKGQSASTSKYRLKPLFKDKEEYNNWLLDRIKTKVKQIAIKNYKDDKCFMGIDSGSTTTKITVTGINNELLFKFYANNKGNSIETVKDGLKLFAAEVEKAGRTDSLHIKHTGVTGYGEDLVKAAFGIDIGMVETIAHYTAARHFNNKVSFIMDIGGQDMKAIFINNEIVSRIELNESCSSGCGSFIETFGKSLGFAVDDFANLACNANAPSDLGTRCTVFMNSKVKQSLRENASIEDIAAGLSISVIKNALYKVLKLKNVKELGDNIVVQGGTFRNASIHRALEQLTGKKVICTDIPELMGAYGAAILATDTYFSEVQPLIPDGVAKNCFSNQHTSEQVSTKSTSFIGMRDLDKINNYKTKQFTCKGCENFCNLTRFTFDNKNIFFSGNKCEKIFSNRGSETKKGFNLFQLKNDLLFQRSTNAVEGKLKSKLTLGIPRILNMYENFPFWNTLFTECGIDVTLSPPSTMKVYEKGQGTVMSDSICFPAKLVHGHVLELAKSKVDRIFHPIVLHEESEFNNEDNTFNCPIVSSYADVVKSAINTEQRFNIPYDSPTITFANNLLLAKACFKYLKQFGVKKSVFNLAFQKSLQEQKTFKQIIKQKAEEIIINAEKKNSLLIVLAGRPYQADPLINHKTPEILTAMGVDVITEDSLPLASKKSMADIQVLSQWGYPNRIYNASQWVSSKGDNIQLVQFNSFGCGPDAIVIDESTEILKSKGKNHTLIRIDDITSTGSVKLRLRSMIESLKIRDRKQNQKQYERKTTRIFGLEDKRRTILAPNFAGMYSIFIPGLFELAGYKLEILPLPDKASVDYGLKYSNNEICYPATIVVGDFIKALKSGNYNLDEIAIGISQTGGQCRASTYLSLIKKALIDAGFEDVPVIAIGTAGKTINPQPGFNVDWKSILSVTFVTLLLADVLAKMYYSTVIREINKGETKKLLEKYQALIREKMISKNIKALHNLIRDAVDEFNQIEVDTKKYPKIGIVGEIYVKYNSFGHHFIVDWLIEQGIEVVVPPIIDFFIQEFVNIDVNKKMNLFKADLSDWFAKFIELKANKQLKKIEKIYSNFKFYNPFHKIRDLAKKASEILSLANQFGEGWLIPAEISAFSEEGVNSVVSIQPFGCIANHVVSKGVEKKIKDLYPDMSLLFLDFDDGTTEVNILNRLHFLVKNVREQIRMEG